MPYEELRKANDELRQVNEDLSKQVSFLMQQITKCRTRKHWRMVCTSDKFKGQLVKLSFKHTWDFARGFVALAETGTDDFDRILGDELDPELDPLAYPNQ